MADQQVKTSQRPFSEEVKKADQSREQRPAYEWSNGRKFDQPKDLYRSNP